MTNDKIISSGSTHSFETAQLKGNNWETENSEGQSKPLCTVNMRVIYQNIWGHEEDKSFEDVSVFSSVLRRPAQLEIYRIYDDSALPLLKQPTKYKIKRY